MILGVYNGLWPSRHQPIILTNVDLSTIHCGISSMKQTAKILNPWGNAAEVIVYRVAVILIQGDGKASFWWHFRYWQYRHLSFWNGHGRILSDQSATRHCKWVMWTFGVCLVVVVVTIICAVLKLDTCFTKQITDGWHEIYRTSYDVLFR